MHHGNCFGSVRTFNKRKRETNQPSTSLSPSNIQHFKKCQRKFYFKYVHFQRKNAQIFMKNRDFRARIFNFDGNDNK